MARSRPNRPPVSLQCLYDQVLLWPPPFISAHLPGAVVSPCEKTAASRKQTPKCLALEYVANTVPYFAGALLFAKIRRFLLKHNELETPFLVGSACVTAYHFTAVAFPVHHSSHRCSEFESNCFDNNTLHHVAKSGHFAKTLYCACPVVERRATYRKLFSTEPDCWSYGIIRHKLPTS